MEPTISSALSLLLIGMITVFLVLFLVVVTGNLLIRLVNRFVSEELAQPSPASIEPNKLAAITAAIETITQGKGKITKVEKLK